MRKLMKEPLVHFLLLGLIIFMTSSYVKSHKAKASHAIVVDNAVIGRIVMMYRLQNNTMMNKQQLDAMIEQHINDEIMYREAERMGLDKDDEIIRRRLIQKFDFINSDISTLAVPDEATLKKFYDGNPALFRDSATVSFTHIYFNTDNKNDETAKQKALKVLKELKQIHQKKRAPERGDRFALQYDYSDIDKLEAIQLFGTSEMTESLFTAEPGAWFGPVQSGYGQHLVLITHANAARVPEFETIQQRVKEAYLNAMSEKQNREKFSDIKSKYSIEREYLERK